MIGYNPGMGYKVHDAVRAMVTYPPSDYENIFKTKGLERKVDRGNNGWPDEEITQIPWRKSAYRRKGNSLRLSKR